ncbi:MAG: LacI family DNA-binding transcriptional regulator, partial [Salinibacterium sp.]|nr:LacI family DNA-binding transcriptional regulator [Salinibacterium sp.]
MASLEDIANEVGVSKSTVSLVLNGKARKARISERRIKEITEAADRL